MKLNRSAAALAAAPLRMERKRVRVLSDRRQRVLQALIEEYVARALPVGSRTLTERYHLGVSSATVRNELSALEDDGYITQPHTSAGRVPTDFGYRAFVDGLLATGIAPEEERYTHVIEELKAQANELDSLLEQASAAVSRLTNCLSVVIAPSVLNLRIKQLTLISLHPRRAVVVLVTEDGQVFNRQLDFDVDVAQDDLAHVQNFLNDALLGSTLKEVEEGLGRGMNESFRNPLVRMVLDEVLSCLTEGSANRTHQGGMSALLAQPEFAQSEALLPVIQVLEDDTVLLRILGDAASSSGTTVRIGSENASENLSGVSVVASRYGRGSSAGVVAVIGPTRMDYSNVIRAVRAASAALKDV